MEVVRQNSPQRYNNHHGDISEFTRLAMVGSGDEDMQESQGLLQGCKFSTFSFPSLY